MASSSGARSPPAGSVGTTQLAALAVTLAKLAASAVDNSKVAAAAAIDYSKLNLLAQILKADLSNGAIARVLIPFTVDSGTAAQVNGTQYYCPIGGYAQGAGLPGTVEANGRTTLTGYTMVVREIHAIGKLTCAELALRDDGADVTGTLLTPTVANTEVSATGLNVTIAATSLIGLRLKGDASAAAFRIGGHIIADLYP